MNNACMRYEKIRTVWKKMCVIIEISLAIEREREGGIRDRAWTL